MLVRTLISSCSSTTTSETPLLTVHLPAILRFNMRERARVLRILTQDIPYSEKFCCVRRKPHSGYTKRRSMTKRKARVREGGIRSPGSGTKQLSPRTQTRASPRMFTCESTTGETGWLEKRMRVPRMSGGRLSSGNFADEAKCRYVLPQHYLFQLAEHPPSDLPVLLNIFRTIPPLIKRRANELLDEIRVGESGGDDSNGSQKPLAVFSRTEESEPVDDPQNVNYKESGIFLLAPLSQRAKIIIQCLPSSLLSDHTRSSTCSRYHTDRKSIV